jgi:nicotinate-nucleotide pyrophosphorylase (carboxylating)
MHGVVAGVAVVDVLVREHFPRITMLQHIADGAVLTGPTRILTIKGPARDVLLLERTMLNFLGRLSGVASLTRKYVLAASEGAAPSTTIAHVCDTRKTTPGLRVLEKYAVRCGGGISHRMGLHDALLIKDNHLAGVPLQMLGSFVQQAATKARELARNHLLFTEVEVDNEAQLDQLLSLPAGTIDVVLLDNMPAAHLRACCAMRDARQPALLLEASGGVNLSTIRDIAQSGVDRYAWTVRWLRQGERPWLYLAPRVGAASNPD